MTRKWILPLTYAPKIPKVLSGECTQTIRPDRKFQVGDQVAFHGWEGRPYRSKWSFRTPFWEIRKTIQITLLKDGIKLDPEDVPNERDQFRPFTELDFLAEMDGIVPPNGEELGRVLISMHKIQPEGLPAQIIRWRFEPCP